MTITTSDEVSEESVCANQKGRKFTPKRAYIPYTALTLDEAYRVCTYGDAASSLFGFPEVTMLGKHVSNLLPAFSPALDTASSQPSVPLQLKNVRMEALHADGNTFPVMVGLRQDCLHGTCRHLVLIRNLEERQQA